MQKVGRDAVEVDPISDPSWHRLAARASVFHSPNWINVLRQTYGFKPKAIILLDAEGIPGAGLAYCMVEDPLFGRRISSLPFSDYCDPIASTREDWEMLLHALSLHDCPVSFRCLRNDMVKRDGRLETIKTAKWHGLSLAGTSESLWAVIRDSTRRAVERARRGGLSVQVETSREALSDFFNMHLGVRKRKYRLLAQPRLFFENISGQFFSERKGFILMARDGATPVAGALFLVWNGTIYYKFNASDPKYLGLRPNDLLVWEGMLLGKRLGCRFWDFGLSDVGQEGLVRFKRHFGSVEREIRFLRYEPRSDPIAKENEQHVKQLLGEVTQLFTEPTVPDEVTERAGNLLYRFFA